MPNGYAGANDDGVDGWSQLGQGGGRFIHAGLVGDIKLQVGDAVLGWKSFGRSGSGVDVGVRMLLEELLDEFLADT
jgi:hypothetical protein